MDRGWISASHPSHLRRRGSSAAAWPALGTVSSRKRHSAGPSQGRGAPDTVPSSLPYPRLLAGIDLLHVMPQSDKGSLCRLCLRREFKCAVLSDMPPLCSPPFGIRKARFPFPYCLTIWGVDGHCCPVSAARGLPSWELNLTFYIQVAGRITISQTAHSADLITNNWPCYPQLSEVCQYGDVRC